MILRKLFKGSLVLANHNNANKMLSLSLTNQVKQ